MPPLTKEVLRDMSTENMPGRWKFVRFGLVIRNRDRSGGKKDLNGTTVGQLVYYTPATNVHRKVLDEVQRDQEAGRIEIPHGAECILEDAGDIKIKNHTVVLCSFSGTLKVGIDRDKRRYTAKLVREDIGKSEVPVDYECAN